MTYRLLADAVLLLHLGFIVFVVLGGFVEHYLWPLIYPAALTREMQIGIGIGIGVVLINLLAYAWWLRARHSRS